LKTIESNHYAHHWIDTYSIYGKIVIEIFFWFLKFFNFYGFLKINKYGKENKEVLKFFWKKDMKLPHPQTKRLPCPQGSK
jgi:hypothetical protein